LIDIPEHFERDIANIGGKPIALSEIKFNLDEIKKDKHVIIYCGRGRSGVVN